MCFRSPSKTFSIVHQYWVYFRAQDTIWPRSNFCGDPYQLLPNAGAQRPGSYCYKKQLSFLDVGLRNVCLFCGMKNIMTLKLNTQYRMVHLKSNLENAISHSTPIIQVSLKCPRQRFQLDQKLDLVSGSYLSFSCIMISAFF